MSPDQTSIAELNVIAQPKGMQVSQYQVRGFFVAGLFSLYSGKQCLAKGRNKEEIQTLIASGKPALTETQIKAFARKVVIYCSTFPNPIQKQQDILQDLNKLIASQS